MLKNDTDIMYLHYNKTCSDIYYVCAVGIIFNLVFKIIKNANSV